MVARFLMFSVEYLFGEEQMGAPLKFNAPTHPFEFILNTPLLIFSGSPFWLV